MQIIYGGSQIASDPPAGNVGILGFQVPRGEQNIQWLEGMRAADAFPIARFNRKRTLTGEIYPEPLQTLAAAKRAREQFYEVLPASGPLLLMQDTELTTFAYAAMQGVDVVEAVTWGVSFGLKLTFAVGPPQFSSNANIIVTTTGKVIVTTTGDVITTQQ